MPALTMTTATATASPLPEILGTNDGVTYSREAALKAARLFAEASFTLYEGDANLALDLAGSFAEFLGGKHWLDIADQLIDEALALGPVTRT
jgi:hypothetical protein